MIQKILDEVLRAKMFSGKPEADQALDEAIRLLSALCVQKVVKIDTRSTSAKERKPKEDSLSNTSLSNTSLIAKDMPKNKRRSRAEILTPFSDEVRQTVNDLASCWPKHDPKDGRVINVSAEIFAENLEAILQDNPSITALILTEAAETYIAEPRERYKAPQYFFGPEGPWASYVRAILTRGR